MSKVFVGGSRRISRLNEQVRRRLDRIIEKNLTVLVGDANGADKAVQKYLAERNYENVVVYCMGGACRNNVGHWDKRQIQSDPKKRGWEHYAQKDAAMAKDASYGFMLWDGISRGTLNNLLNLVHDGKTTLVYFGPEKKFYTVHVPEDIRLILSRCDSKARETLKVQLDLEQKLASAQTELPLEKHSEPDYLRAS